MGASPDFRICLSASGSIGKTMTATRWKRCGYWRPYAKPGTEQSANQQFNTAKFAQANAAWKSNFKTAEIRTGWARLSSLSSTPMTGYDVFISSAYQAMTDNPNAQFVTTGIESLDRIRFSSALVGPGGGPQVTQPVDIWMGYNQNQSTLFGTSNISNYGFLTPPLPGPGIYYFHMTTRGVPISGLIRIVYNP